MTLDTHVKAFLDVLAAANRPKVWEVTRAEARNMAFAFAEIVEAKGVPIGKVENGTLPRPQVRFSSKSILQLRRPVSLRASSFFMAAAGSSAILTLTIPCAARFPMKAGAVSYRLIIALRRNTSSLQPSTMPMRQPNGWRRMHPN